jgi:hypothetical protein
MGLFLAIFRSILHLEAVFHLFANSMKNKWQDGRKISLPLPTRKSPMLLTKKHTTPYAF